MKLYAWQRDLENISTYFCCSECHYVNQENFREAVLCSDIGTVTAVVALAATLVSQ